MKTTDYKKIAENYDKNKYRQEIKPDEDLKSYIDRINSWIPFSSSCTDLKLARLFKNLLVIILTSFTTNIWLNRSNGHMPENCCMSNANYWLASYLRGFTLAFLCCRSTRRLATPTRHLFIHVDTLPRTS